MRTTMTFDKIRNTTLLGIAGLGAAAGIALGPAATAHAAPATPVADTAPAAAPAAAPASAPTESMIAKYDGALQPNGYYCGPAATRIALSAHGTPPTFDSLASELGTTESGTQSIDEVTRVLNAHRGNGVYASTKIDGNKATTEQADKLRTDVIDSI